VIRIIGGEFRSRQLLTPPDAAVTRPYAQRVKESVFNLLREWFEDARVLDLFAGVGTMGLEAVSRGAAEVVMIERDRKMWRLLERNIERLGCGDRVTAVHGDALTDTSLHRAPAPVDVAFIDPPYAMMIDESTRRRVLAVMSRLRRVMADQSFLVLRSPEGPERMDLTIEGLEGPEPHQYSRDMWVLLYQPSRSTIPEAGASDPVADPDG
jgi:16S rRNA (guanine966-N2)-methyltransferase